MSSKYKFSVPTLEELDNTEKEKNYSKFSSLQTFQQHRKLKAAEETSLVGGTSASAGVEQNKTDLGAVGGVSDSNILNDAVEIGKIPNNAPNITNHSPSDKECIHMKNVEVSVPGTPPRPGKVNALIVSRRQRGNPILKHIRNIPWEFGDITPDYELSKTSCALFLSLRYHNLNPNYIHERLKQLGHSYDLRVLLVQVDVKDPHHALQDLAQICILSDCTLILAWTVEEAGRYLETFKAFENKPPDLIMEKTEVNFLCRMSDCLTSVKKINKTDSMTLLSAFGSFHNMVKANEEDLSLCPGFGPQKAKKLYDAFHEPFLKSHKRKKKEPSNVAIAAQPSVSKIKTSKVT